ncbi:hypothetical protein DR62_06890 [Burkholderia thailandensis]|uniref:Uncharacterized protein n=1 Tax=Burkholderia thailandensis TaxID=57975 RepID=A0AAW9D175_BURTH|nr:hypothetical protein DR62_06890 [Burkholderia thailandensis]AOI51433.1 hypothetical protein WI24_06190 [Burkholderia thailandensis]AOJ45832.1 hypothetical protein WJ27_12505 [Burkholderia thailandensis]AOJ50460.1 hypothetical protein AQ475_06130 [Burkholderia thailandensis]AOJ57313.1 hypothetical protein AQ477_12965 [Burkholderia thailandensis]
MATSRADRRPPAGVRRLSARLRRVIQPTNAPRAYCDAMRVSCSACARIAMSAQCTDSLVG